MIVADFGGGTVRLFAEFISDCLQADFVIMRIKADGSMEQVCQPFGYPACFLFQPNALCDQWPLGVNVCGRPVCAADGLRVRCGEHQAVQGSQPL